MQIYGGLKELVIRNDLEFYDDYYIKNELKGLRVRYTENGFKIKPNPKGEVPTDDTADCIAAICHLSTDSKYLLKKRFPTSRVVNHVGFYNSMRQMHSLYDRKFQ